MMNKELQRKRIAEEFDLYYSTFDPQTERLMALLDQADSQHGNETSYERKTRLVETLCGACEPHLFRESPFFFELSSGRERYTWGGLQSKAGLYLHDKTAHLWLQPYADALKEDRDQGFMQGWNNPVGIDHHCLDYDLLLTEGVNGVISRTLKALEACTDERKRIFYNCMLRCDRALLRVAERFEALARTLQTQAKDEEEKAHYERIAEAAAWVPAHPARTFYEALCTILFCREVIGTMDGIGVSTFSQVDRMLWPYYEADIVAGRTTREEALELIHALFIYTEIRFDTARCYRETSTTMILGGCDRQGNMVYNEVTKLVLQAVREGGYYGTKVNCRISPRHPRDYYEKIAEIQTAGIPTLVMQNDDVIIPARVRLGQAEEDARLYVSGGCHEIVLAGTEVQTRSDTWINLPRILLATLEKAEKHPDYEAFYAAFLHDAKAYHERIVQLKNEGEKHWCEYNPLPLYSSVVSDCIEKGMDVTEGGARYSTTTLSMLSTATLIDSLYAIRHLVFDTGRISLDRLREVLSKNFEGDEVLRQYILRRIPKYGTNNEELNAFSAQVLQDLSKISGQKNARGGDYLPAFYPHEVFLILGLKTGATPDGRLSGAPLSRGCSPSEFIEVSSPLDILYSLKPIDFSAYADSFCTELTLPPMSEEEGKNILPTLIETFLEMGGSSLQFNLLDREKMLDAQIHPENHAGLIVRVCGFSEKFIFLTPVQQEEVINRAIR